MISNATGLNLWKSSLEPVNDTQIGGTRHFYQCVTSCFLGAMRLSNPEPQYKF